jgi:hypothetical protein
VGDTNYLAAPDVQRKVRVERLPTTTKLKLSREAVRHRRTVQMKAKVSSDLLTPIGVMRFSRGRRIIDIVEVDPNGSAKVPFKAPRHPRTYTLHAVYTDNAANFAGSQDEVELKVR